MMQERINTIFARNPISVSFDQQSFFIEVFWIFFIHPKYQIPIEQISYIKLRKRFIWFGKEGFEINYRLYPKGALLGFFFVSKQPQAWIDTFTAADIKLIPSP
ncbi:hypothetical protein [Herpetosiphon giganteus]|uniref:hypothetical protein n=1 Tax=Herpetosiphon giganteus TaxID=2029754 RepID=UPI00195D2C69|nr:hypothetical protein [Herpetosiphon giganteus]MBM7842075.1 hypothetical protein [Herpetosiphon giganteus]